MLKCSRPGESSRAARQSRFVLERPEPSEDYRLDDAYTQITTVRVIAGCLMVMSCSCLRTCAQEGTGRKAIVYFTAKWCPPCKMIGPIYDELSAKYEDIDFAKLDVDELNDTTSKAGVRSMPTFFYFKDGKFQQSLSFSGADEELLRSNVKQLNDL
ncbi:hypothetical protein PInf_000614 [Phytophthora infestans]|nr:hypothetical protein PInf_000614 [Phytophthora infestans]